ncbi:MAG: YfiT family bacillithiol transferase [Bacteroidota bacterium]
MTRTLEQWKYPIGRYAPPGVITPAQIAQWIDEVEALPTAFRAAVEEVDESELDLPYRPGAGAWTVRQLVHHVPESHMNGFVRFKWTLTEDQPTIKAYHENAWANLPDARLGPIDIPLDLLDAVHRTWVQLLRRLEPADFERTFTHPETNHVHTLAHYLGLYAWHGAHHRAHVSLRSSGG